MAAVKSPTPTMPPDGAEDRPWLGSPAVSPIYDGHGDISLTSIPRDFLEKYPHPAFVVPCGLPPDPSATTPGRRPRYTAASHDSLEPLTITWSNRHWRRKSGGRPLLDCVSTESARWLGDWLSGASESGFPAPLHDDRLSVTGPSPYCRNEDGETSLILEFTFPGGTSATYHLAKTSVPIFRKGSLRHEVQTHVFMVITAIPHPPLVASRGPDTFNKIAPLSDIASSEAGAMDLMRPFDPPVRPPEGVPDDQLVPASTSEPVRLHDLRDVDPEGRPYDVRRLLATVDWSKTPLGPMDTWSYSLRTFVPTLMINPTRAVLWSGRQFTQMYNQSYADTIPDHPAAFGRSGPESWAQIWAQLGPETEAVLAGESIHREDEFHLFMNPADGKTYETYRTNQWIPLRDGDGDWAGLFNCNNDTTAKVLEERRGNVVREMSERTSIGRTVEEFAAGVLETIAENPKDAPFALLYLVEQESGRLSQSHPRRDALERRVQLTHAGSVGAPYGTPSTPQSLRLTLPADSSGLVTPFTFGGAESTEVSSPCTMRSLDGSASATELMRRTVTPTDTNLTQWPFVEALSTHRTVYVQDCRHLLEGFEIRVWDELPTSAVVVPVMRDTDEGIPGAVMVLGISCRLEFTKEYESFIHSFRIQIASYLVAVKSYCQDQELIQQLAELDRAKNLLFSNVSHELLTPIGLVEGPIDDLLAEMPSNTPGHHRLLIVRRSVAQLKRLVSMLMEVSELEAGRHIGCFSLVNLGVLTRDAAGMYRKGLEKKGIEFTVECDLSPRDMYVDRESWEKILVTVMNNAVKYTRKGFVHLTFSYDNGHAIFSVQDTSRGISKAYVENLGDQIFQRDHNDAPTGAIIALAFIRKLAQLHGGRVEIESHMAHEAEDGSHGTRVTIYIPLGCAHLPPEDIISPQAAARREIRPFEAWDDGSVDSPPTADRKSWGVDPSTLYLEPDDLVLIVDDLADGLRYMRSILEPFCKVVTARNGAEALEIFNWTPADLVIADVTIRNPSGQQFLHDMRNGTREMQMVPFIMLTTSYDSRPDHAVQADEYLAKPFNARDLLVRVNMQMQLGKRRRALEARFDERTAEMRALTEESPIGVFRATPEGTMTYCNPMWHQHSGYPVGEREPIPIHDWVAYFSEEHQPMVLDNWGLFIADQSCNIHRNDGLWKTGLWCTFTIVKLFNAAGECTGVLGCSMDITERKLNEQLQLDRTIQAEQRRREAEEAKAQQELLIDITSHEIRNPISSLMQCSSLVKTNLIGLQEELGRSIEGGVAFQPTRQLLQTIEEDLDALDSIYECALTQERISNDVLSLGKIQLDLLQMFDVETNIREEAQKIVNVFQNEARMNRVDLTLTFFDAFNQLGVSNIKTDPVRLGQVLTNLIANAIRFVTSSDERRIDVRVDLGTQPPLAGTCVKPKDTEPVVHLINEDTPLYLYIAVADTGPGLLPSELETLFQRFTQASAKTHTVFGGSGLGLFVCRKITELMGGRIEVASEYTQGSVFRFFVQTRAASLTVPPRIPPRRRKLASFSAEAPEQGDTLRVLIVEDNVINRTVLQRQLKHVGLIPDAVGNGLEAVEKLRGLGDGPGYDCILMDLEMPVMDGYTATRLLREDETKGASPNGIIALTGNARQALLQEQMIDFDEVVVKPYRLDDLLRKVVSVSKQRAAGNVGGAARARLAAQSPPTRPPPTPLTPPSRDGRAFSEPSVPLWSAVEKMIRADEEAEREREREMGMGMEAEVVVLESERKVETKAESKTEAKRHATETKMESRKEVRAGKESRPGGLMIRGMEGLMGGSDSEWGS